MTAPPREPLIDAIRHAINCHSAENASNTPDYILAQFLGACLAAFNTTTQQRETWHGRDARPSAPAPSAEPPAQAATDDLVQRLRVRSINVWDAPFALRDEAADALQRLRAENTELTAEARTANERHHVETERRVRAEAERDTLAAIVRAADMMRLADEVTDHYIPDWARYDAARAKWGKP